MLYPYQQNTVDNIIAAHDTRHENRSGLFFHPGLGKTRTALTVAKKYIEYGIVKNVFLIIPAGLQVTWEAEILFEGLDTKYFTVIPYSKLSMREKENPKNPKAEIMALFKNFSNKTLMIFDESHYLKTHKSKRTKFVLALLKRFNPFIVSLTGTPSPKDIRDLWIQCKLLNAWPNGVEMKYTQFEDRYCLIQSNGIYKRYDGERPGARNAVLNALKGKAYFISKEDVLDLPSKIYDRRFYMLTSNQKKLLLELKREALAVADPTTDYISKSMQNMLSICSGFVSAKCDENGILYDGGKLIRFDRNPKLQLLEAIIKDELGDQQFILFCTRHPELETLSKMLESFSVGFSTRSGQQTKDQNDKAVEDFKSGNSQCLLATVQSTCEGLNLQQAATIVYYSNTYNLLHRVQSEDRIHRIGQTKPCVYIDLVGAGAPDFKLLDSLVRKNTDMQSIFKMFLTI